MIIIWCIKVAVKVNIKVLFLSVVFIDGRNNFKLFYQVAQLRINTILFVEIIHILSKTILFIGFLCLESNLWK